jgi:hypothetical protein
LWYTPIETFDQLGHDHSSMNSQRITDRTENEKWAINRTNIANAFHGATEDTLATMTCATLPVQQQLELYVDRPAAVQIPTTATITDLK